MSDIILTGLVLGFIFGGVFAINKGLKRYIAKNKKRIEKKDKKDTLEKIDDCLIKK